MVKNNFKIPEVMKNWLMAGLILLVVGACTGPKKVINIQSNGKEQPGEDSLAYELIILDPGFDTWYLLHNSPVWYHSQEYYENWNLRYVSAWNSKTVSSRHSRFFESYIDYLPHIDYGFELNHKLFYYFQYVEQVLKVPILEEGFRPHTVF